MPNNEQRELGTVSPKAVANYLNHPVLILQQNCNNSNAMYGSL